jgi:glycosyltransferase involved in cell wall biosynthesis
MTAGGENWVTVDATSIPEVAGSAAALVDPTDCRAIAYSLVEILTDPERKRELRAAGRDRVASFSWEKTARELWCL